MVVVVTMVIATVAVIVAGGSGEEEARWAVDLWGPERVEGPKSAFLSGMSSRRVVFCAGEEALRVREFICKTIVVLVPR